MSGWIPLAVTVLLSTYGWWLITQLANRREAYDLYCSIISLLEQLRADGIRVWTARIDDLDEYTELMLTSKVADVEQRLRIIQQYYGPRQEPKAMIIDSRQIADLRSYLTKAHNLEPSERTRHIFIQRLTATMVAELLEANYENINKRRWLPF